MTDARSELLDRIVDEVAAHGLADRSLRDIATAVGSSHRMVLYHFGSREGLVAAIVDAVEAQQRDLLRTLAEETDDPAELVMQLWAQVSSPELRPFVRLFFETVAATAGARRDAMTAPWIEAGDDVSHALGIDADAADLRLGVAVTRGLLIDVLLTGEVEPATAALQRYVDLSMRGRDRASGTHAR